MRRVEIARRGRNDGLLGYLRVGGPTPSAVVAGAWLARHVGRLPRMVDQRLYLWAFQEGWQSAVPTSKKKE